MKAHGSSLATFFRYDGGNQSLLLPLHNSSIRLFGYDYLNYLRNIMILKSVDEWVTTLANYSRSIIAQLPPLEVDMIVSILKSL